MITISSLFTSLVTGISSLHVLEKVVLLTACVVAVVVVVYFRWALLRGTMAVFGLVLLSPLKAAREIIALGAKLLSAIAGIPSWPERIKAWRIRRNLAELGLPPPTPRSWARPSTPESSDTEPK